MNDMTQSGHETWLSAGDRQVPTQICTFGPCSKVHSLFIFPNPGALNYCMHTFPEKHVGVTMVYYILVCIWIWDLRPSV